MPSSIRAIEYYLPENVETNDDLALKNPEWVMEDVIKKTGSYSRHISGDDECASDLAYNAAIQLFDKNGIDKTLIDGLIFCTQSPDFFLPSSACILQDRIGLSRNTASFDINMGCSGFIYALMMANSMICSGCAQNVLVLCADTYTKYIDPTDRTCRSVFGDGAAAVFVSKSEHNDIGPFVFGSDGKGAQSLIVKGGACRYPYKKSQLYMDGSKMFMFALSEVPKAVNKLLAKTGMKMGEINQFFFHQASKLIIEGVSKKLKLPSEKVFFNIEEIGNTVSASIPIAVRQAHDCGRIKNQTPLLFAGFGVGLSWGACISHIDL